MNDDLFSFEDLKLEPSTLSQITNSFEDEPIQEEPKEELQEQKEEIKTEPENKETPSSESTEDSSTFSVFANLLKEEGVISLEDEELKAIKTSNDLIEAVKKQIEKSKFENLSESQKRYLEAVQAGIPQSEYEKLEKELNQLEKIDDEVLSKNTQARFDLIAYDYIAKGIDKDKAVELANRSIKLGTDIDDAKEALASLIKIKSEQYKNSIVTKQTENKVSLEELKTKIESKDTILKDVKLTPKQKTDLFNLVSTKVDADESGQPINEFNKWRKDNGVEAEIILGAIYQLTNKFQNLGKILEVSKSKASLELEKRLKSNEMTDMNNSLTLGNKTFDINI